MRESTIEKHLVIKCREHGYLCWKFTSPGLRGVPDRIIISPSGAVYFIELKCPSGRPSPIQLRRYRELESHGRPTIFAYNVEQIDRFFLRHAIPS